MHSHREVFMRFIPAACLAGSVTVVTLIACSPEEYPNPPANPNGAESSSGSSGASLPGVSSPGGSSGSSGTSGAQTEKDAGKDVSSTPAPPGPTSGLDGTKAFGTLSQAEKKQLCDW